MQSEPTQQTPIIKPPPLNQNNRQIDDGFLSQQQAEQQIIYNISDHIDDYLTSQNQITTVRHLDHVRDVATKRYSLQPDMITGWMPKITLPKPVPLTFCNAQFDQMINKAINTKKLKAIDQQNNPAIQLCYLGARYETTYYAWYDKDFQFPYKHLNSPKNIVITDRQFVGQHWDAQKPSILRFNSIFQSGNLDCVTKVGQFQYDLFIRIDSNTRGHLQWFNFKVSNFAVNVKYRFNICNFQKGKNLYNRGMRPYCFSNKKCQFQGIGWHQLEGEVKFRKKVSKSQKLLDFQMTDKFYQLSFQISTTYQNDQIQLAYCIPYTYSKLKCYLSQLQHEHSGNNFIMIKKLCTSLGGHPVDELTITENPQQQQQAFKNKQKLNKKVIFITGRCHPGQSNGSWMTEGFINALCKNTEIAIFMRKHYIFKIIPMLNPDGVIIGNFRTGIFGKDFNREFHCPDKDVFPQIYHLKEMFWNYKQIYRENAYIYIDFHGHSVKKNVFAYGPQYPITHKNYYECRMIAKFIAMKSKMFRYHSCIFKISQSKQSTGRAIFLKSHKIPFTFTIQASNGCYFDQDQSINSDFNQQKYKEVGQKILQGIYDYLKLISQLQLIKQQKIKQRKQLIMRNRERRVKIKKHHGTGNNGNNNNKMGYMTSIQFRKCKTMMSQERQDQNGLERENQNFGAFMEGILEDIGQFQGSQKLNLIFEQIKKQQKAHENNQNSGNKQSDDQISQGSSDSQGSKDDLDLNQQNKLLGSIKKKRKANSKLEIKKINKKIDYQQLKTPTLKQQNSQPKINTQSYKTSTKQILIKKYQWKKKNSGFTNISPKKEEGSVAAKILNFNFSLNPVQCTLNQHSQNPFLYGENTMSAFSQSYYNSKSSSNCFYQKNQQRGFKLGENQQQTQKKMALRGNEYSDTFKKTFISVQKQIQRRDNIKRYLISQSQNKRKVSATNNIYIDNIRGKKISNPHTEQSQQSKNRYYEQRKHSISPEKYINIQSPSKGPARQTAYLRDKQRKQGGSAIKKPLVRQVVVFKEEQSREKMSDRQFQKSKQGEVQYN